MKNKASVFLKQVLCLLSSVVKAKSMAIKNKTSAAKVRLFMFSLMKSKKFLLGSIPDKIHGLLGHHDHKEKNEDDVGDQSKAIVIRNASTATEPITCMHLLENDEDVDKHPDLTHSLFDEEDLELDDDQGGSIIDLVRNSKEEGEDFSLEEEIDHVADLFIKRFHKQMRLQKLESFKRFQEMLARGV